MLFLSVGNLQSAGKARPYWQSGYCAWFFCACWDSSAGDAERAQSAQRYLEQ
jgi:hypothetical protein